MKRRLALLTLALLFLGAGCDSSDNPIAPTGSTLTVSASPTTIALTGQVSVISISGFRPDGNPLNPGTQLTVSTTLGTLTDDSGAAANVIEVEENGRATARLQGDGRQGTATVTVSLTTGGDGASATLDIQIGVAGGDQPTLTVDANPNEVDVNENSTITVTARNSDGTPLTAGTVNIRTNLGTLFFDGNSGATLAVPLSGGSNVVSVGLRSSQAGTATVTASVGSSAEESITVEIGTSTTGQPNVSVGANPTEIRLGGGAEGTSQITVTARQPNGALLQGGQVSLRTSLGTLQATSGTTGSDGNFVTNLVSGSQAGTATITVSVGSSAEQTVDVTIGTGDIPKPVVTLNANPSTVELGGTLDERTSVITVTARDSQGFPLPGTSEAVLTADRGRLEAAGNTSYNPTTRRLTLQEGVGDVLFIAEGPAGNGQVTAFVENSDIATVNISIRDVPQNIGLEVSPQELPASGDQTFTLTATVTNDIAQRLPDEPVTFSIDNDNVGGNFNPNPAFTNNNGVATSTIILNNDDLGLAPGTQIVIRAATREDGVEATVTVIVQ